MDVCSAVGTGVGSRVGGDVGAGVGPGVGSGAGVSVGIGADVDGTAESVVVLVEPIGVWVLVVTTDASVGGASTAGNATSADSGP
jgi:hypothetical protein